MRKLTLALGIAATFFSPFVSPFAHAQGYGVFTGPPRGVWDAFHFPTGPLLQPSENVAFLWGTGTPLISSIAISTPTNTFVASPGTAWSAILNDPAFHFATNSSLNAAAIASVTVNGAWAYNGAATFPVLGTAPGNYQLYVIAWDDTYADPYQAAAANATLGWSAPFTYNLTSQIGTPFTFATSGFVPFGVQFVPEPGTLSLVGLAMLILLRRRRAS